MGKVKGGDHVSAFGATEWNRHVETSDWFHKNKARGERLPFDLDAPPSTAIVVVRNDTGADLEAGHVVDLVDQPLTGTPERRHPWFTAGVPNAQRASAIVVEPIPADEYGPAQLAGICRALVDFTSTSHPWARVANGEKVLQSNADSGPARVVVAPSGTGEQLVWVALGASSAAATPLGIPFVNVSGFTVPPGGIMNPDLSVTIGGVDHLRTLRPSATFRRRWLVNGPTPVPNGAASLGSWLDDLAGFAAIDPGSAQYIQSTYGWGPNPDSFFLYPAYFGFTIEAITTYTFFGQLTAQARQHEVNTLIGLKLQADLEFDQSAPAKIWRRNTLRKRSETAFNPLDVFDGLKLQEGDKIEKDMRIDAVWNGNQWELANAACATEQSSQSSSQSGVAALQLAPPNFPSAPSFT